MKTEIINKIDTAIKETEKILLNDKNQLLIAFLKELNRYKNLIIDHWPLTLNEKGTIDIGRIAVRELDDLYPDYVTLLSNIGAILREE